MRKETRVTPTATKHKAYVPLAWSQRKDEAERLFENYLNIFKAAPEANFLLKGIFSPSILRKNICRIIRFSYPAAIFSGFLPIM
jgi:hypothetical protein